jgi:SH3 domain protein
MGVCMRLAVLALLGQLPVVMMLEARTMYVSDTFEIVVRSEKNEASGRNILKLLPTGAAVEVADMDDSWATVQLPDGRTGYTLKRYLISRLPYKLLADRLQEELDTQRERLTTLTEQSAALQEEHRRMQQTSASREAQLAEVTQQYAQLQQGAAQYLQLKDELTTLRQAHQQSQQQQAEVNAAYLVIRQSRNLFWFLSGAGVMLTGWVLGVFTERLRGRRRRQEGYSYQLPR